MEVATTALDFDDVYARHSAHVRRMMRRFGVRSADLDDALQDAFVTIHRLLSGFEGRAKLETWIHAICWRVAAGYRRRAHRELVCVTGGRETFSEPEITRGARSDELHAWLGTLEAEDRDLLVLHDIGEISVLALSEMTGRARETVRRRIDGARRSVRQNLDRGTNHDAERAPVRAAPFMADVAALAQLAQHADTREHVCSDYAFTRCGQVLFARWRGVNDARALAIASKVMRGALAETSDSFSYCSIVEPTSAPPDTDARRLTGWLMGEVAPRLRALATVSVSTEHRLLVRQITNACTFVCRAEVTVRHFGELGSTLEWLTRLTPGASPLGLLHHCQDVCARMDALTGG